MNQIKLENIKLNPKHKVTKTYSHTFIAENTFLNSVKENGILNPICIDSQFNLIDGYHRYHIAKILGHKTIPCKVYGINNNPLYKEN